MTKGKIKIVLIISALLCGTSAWASGTLYQETDEAVQRVQNLYSEVGATMPSVSYPVGEADLRRYLLLLHNLVLQKERSLQQAVQEWESSRNSLEQETMPETSPQAAAPAEADNDEEEEAAVVRILVWPSSEDEEDQAGTTDPAETGQQAGDPLDAMYQQRPHDRLESVQELRFRIEDELEQMELRKRSELPISLRQTIALQGFFNAPLNSMSPQEYYDLVHPMVDHDIRVGNSGQPNVLVSFGLARAYDGGQEYVNLPLLEEGWQVPIDSDAFSRVLLEVPFGFGDVVLGRFPAHVGPGSQSFSVNEYVPYLDGFRLVTQGDSLRTTHIAAHIPSVEAHTGDIDDSSFVANYGYGETNILYLLHYAELFLGSFRLGAGGQSMIAAPGNNVPFQQFLPLVPWIAMDAEYINTQLLMDFSFAPSPWTEIYFQGGFQAPVAGWSLAGLMQTAGAALGGARVSFVRPEATASLQFELGWTSIRWGSFTDEYGLSRFVQRLGYGESSTVMALTSPHGPGIIWGSGSIEVARQSFEFGLLFEVIAEKQGIDLISGSFSDTGGAYELYTTASLLIGYNWQDHFQLQVRPAMGQYPEGFVPSVSAGIQFFIDYL